MINLTVRFQASEGKAEDLGKALSRLEDSSRKDAGCLQYDVFVAGQGRFLLIERWQDRQSLDAHLALKHVAAFRSDAAALMACEPELLEWQPLTRN